MDKELLLIQKFEDSLNKTLDLTHKMQSEDVKPHVGQVNYWYEKFEKLKQQLNYFKSIAEPF